MPAIGARLAAFAIGNLAYHPFRKQYGLIGLEAGGRWMAQRECSVTACNAARPWILPAVEFWSGRLKVAS